MKGDRETVWKEKRKVSQRRGSGEKSKFCEAAQTFTPLLWRCLLIEGGKHGCGTGSDVMTQRFASCDTRGKQQQPSGGKLRRLTVCDASGRAGREGGREG